MGKMVMAALAGRIQGEVVKRRFVRNLPCRKERLTASEKCGEAGGLAIGHHDFSR